MSTTVSTSYVNLFPKKLARCLFSYGTNFIQTLSPCNCGISHNSKLEVKLFCTFPSSHKFKTLDATLLLCVMTSHCMDYYKLLGIITFVPQVATTTFNLKFLIFLGDVL